MLDVVNLFGRYRKYLYFLLAFFVLGWGFTTYQHIFAGLFIGTSISFINLWILARKTVKLSESVTTGEGNVYTMGTFSRLAFAALAVLVAIRYPQQIHLIATIIGLMTSYIVIVIDSLIMFLLKRQNGKRGE
ncbi:ATP synthase subunit I [Bacillus kwashiorkori]|uniref:ATP synthase subunit I n=1 Tax=Bacillus kwashiorkori TaxID=1522318 RepID=UPI0007812EDD|nr:ATP synthase subunit I [Bacillus kwashiorkori]